MSAFTNRIVPALLAASAVVLMTIADAPAAKAAETPADPDAQTPFGLYLTAKEAGAMKAAEGDAVLLVDVREPIEIMFTGFTDMVDVNVPFMLDPDFAAGIERALAERGLGKDAPIILMCRSDSDRGAPSARALDGRGFEAVYVVVDGFEGVTSKDTPDAPWRNVNGWKNSGWPWGYALDREKLYIRQ